MTQQPRLEKSGRVLILRKLRDQLGLKAGQAVTLEVDGDGLHLRPAAQATRLVERHGRLILDVPGLSITGDVVENMRRARDAEVLSKWPES